MAGPLVSSLRRLLEPLLATFARTTLLAFVCNAVLELADVVGSGHAPWFGKTAFYPALFLLDATVTWLAIALLHAVVGSIRVTAALSALVTAVVAVIDLEKIRILREPLYPEDWEFARQFGFVASMVGPHILPLLLLVAVLALVMLAASRAAGRWSSHTGQPPRSRWRSAAGRLVAATLCLTSLNYLSHFNSPGNAARGAFEHFGAEWLPSNPQVNYLRNGFVGGYLSNLNVPMLAPSGYGRDELARITEKYGVLARRTNRTRDRHALDDVNVVLVLSESFSDPLALKGLHLDTDPIPFVRSMMTSTTGSYGGNMLSQSFGGRTANLEFEALTGMSVSQLPRQAEVPYQAIVPDYATFPSAAAWMKQRGHRAVAIHPNLPQLYRRQDVYRIFGFDDFVYDKKMHFDERIGHDAWISDEAAFQELMLTLRREEPALVNVVTMQNHMPYDGRYDDPVHVTGPDGEPLPAVGQYLRGLRHSDQAVENLVHRLSRSKERTVVVFYGDHLPSVYPQSVIEENSWRVRHQTPFFVWANFPGAVRTPMPTTSPINFMWLALERANAPVAPYDALIHALWQEIPAIDAGLIIDGRNRQIGRSALSTRALRVLQDYRLVQYDLSVGKRYSEKAMFTVP